MKTQNFTRASLVRRSDTGCYEVLGSRDTFKGATTDECDGTPYEWEILERLIGWGEWTHCVVVGAPMGPRYYFVR